MKKIILFLALICAGKAYAQRVTSSAAEGGRQNYNYSTSRVAESPKNVVNDDNYDQIRIVDSTQEIRADVIPYKSDPKIKNDRYYFWYYNKVIHSTQGGFNGQLLNGHYIAFYPDKNLKEEGEFKRGLKDGVWKTWNPKGDLTAVVTWNEGIAETGDSQPIWKKIPFLKKKDDQQPASRGTSDNQ
jgi:hypothetical protein